MKTKDLIVNAKEVIHFFQVSKQSSYFPQPQVPNSFSADLVISPVHLKDAGFYICRVNSGDAFEFSRWAQVEVMDVTVSCGKILHMLNCCSV